ncbi:Crp/Fnr family transcriptional regulator [Isachenkonia alkalipeptolytica]|uniref:Crp/Fnr family transcriptional regulator n=1 Tax=Isachenkonia alkalipeptolytica TaxID=2565777 RepID=A0AA43XN54_9CLOT|nr:Crp/Fnr family transcriptional regulator [Isachenkonia alkalipeptolytica]NBG89274.1 Crp/Fnr family transcriptional regulator [Isachenkonia alkalipeptolytica]
MFVTREEILRQMSKAFIFKDLSVSDCERILAKVQPETRSYEKNEVIFDEGDQVDYIGLICSGRMVSKRLDPDGKVSLQQILVPPNIIGFEVASTPSKRSPVRMRCLSEVTLLSFPYGKMVSEEDLLPKVHSYIKDQLITLLANENMRRMYKIELLTQRSLRKRVLMYLRFVSGKTGENSFTIPFDREQLAQYLNINRSSLCAELSKMEKEGLISYHKNKFTLKEDS